MNSQPGQWVKVFRHDSDALRLSSVESHMHEHGLIPSRTAFHIGILADAVAGAHTTGKRQ